MIVIAISFLINVMLEFDHCNSCGHSSNKTVAGQDLLLGGLVNVDI